VRHIPGAWRYEDGWPIARTGAKTWHLQAEGGLAPAPGEPFTRSLAYLPAVGTSNRYRLPHNPAELPGDQRADDAYSLSFTSAPLAEALEILGHVRVVLHVATTAPVATWIARLTDVAPDGASTLVTKAILNGTHRDAHSNPSELEPGRVYELALEMKVTSRVFAPGHRIRLAVGNADFPNLWPAPAPMTTQLFVDAERPSRLILPVCPPAARPAPSFRPAAAAPDQFPPRPEPVDSWIVSRDELSGATTVFRETRMPAYRVPDGERSLTVSFGERRWCEVDDTSPGSAAVRAEAEHQIEVDGDVLLVQARLNISGDADSFHVFAERTLSKNGREIRSKRWEETIPRDHV
jgi:hypothetical protein